MEKYDAVILKKYLTLSFGITWLAWGFLVLLTNINIIDNGNIVYSLFFLIGGFGPTIAALLSLKNVEGTLSVKNVKDFVFSKRENSWIYLLIFSILVVLAIYLPSMELNPEIPYFVAPVIWLMMTFFGGGNEELGWRGIMQPMLENKYGFLKATLATGIIWAIWHLPLWFIKGDAHGETSYLLFAITCIPISFVLAGLYKATKSIFHAMILHGLINAVNAVVILKYNILLGITIALVMAFSTYIWYKFDKYEE